MTNLFLDDEMDALMTKFDPENTCNKICIFRLLSKDERAKLKMSAVQEETYESIYSVLESNLLGAIHRFPKGKGKWQ